MNRFALGLVAVMTACMGVSTVAHGAAALASGAATSATPKATNPVKRQMQIAADPVGIIDFQFSLHWDPALLHIPNDALTGLPMVTALNGYRLGVRNNAEAPAYAIDPVNGYVSVRGYWPAESGPLPFGENAHVDVYDVVFELNATWFSGVPIPANTPFIIYSLGVPGEGNPFGRGSPDQMLAGDIVNGQPVVTRTYTAGDPENPILDSNTGAVSIGFVPEPAAMSAVMPAVVLLRRRRR